jgi:hypothetical protein
VKWCIFKTDVPLSPSLILTSERKQNGVLTSTYVWLCLPPWLSYNPDKALPFLHNEKAVLQNMWVHIRQLGWQWRYIGRNCCSEIVKWRIFRNKVRFSHSLILTSEPKQSGDLTPTYTSCIPPWLSYGPDKSLSFYRMRRVMRQYMWIYIRQ